MSLAVIVALPFLGALLPGLTIRLGRNICALLTLVFPVVAFALLASNAPPVLQGGVVLFSVDWMPALGLQAGFMLDGF
jgi:multicomponent K+:H+ antiporter subunit A